MRLFSLLLSVFVASSAISAEAQIITTISGGSSNEFGFAGDGGLAVFGRFNAPGAMVMNDSGDLFISDKLNNRIRKIDRYGYLSTIAGKGVAGRSGDGGAATAAKLNYPTGLVMDKKGNLLFADSRNHCIRKISPDGVITNVAGVGNLGSKGDSGMATEAQLHSPYAVALDDAGNLYISDGGNNKIRKVDTAGVITTFAGTGKIGLIKNNIPATQCDLNNPKGLVYDPKGNILAISVHSIVKINIATGMLTTFSGGPIGIGGDGGPAVNGRFNAPSNLAIDKYGNLFIADLSNNRVRMIDSVGKVSTIAGNGLSSLGDGGDADAASVPVPDGVTTDAKGNLYISDGNHSIRFVYTGDIKAAAMNVFPNPCIEQCTVMMESSFEELATMYVLDAMGNTTNTIVAPTNREIKLTLNIPGVYMLYATSKHKKWQGKVMSLPRN